MKNLLFYFILADQSSAVIIGVLVLASIGAVLGACICCKRRKRGFEVSHIIHNKVRTPNHPLTFV